MISSFIIVFREMLEMALVLGVLLAATEGVVKSRSWIAIGAGIGLLGAVIVALLMEELENAMQGDGEFLFNAIVLTLASVMIGWTVIWMRQHGREMTLRMKSVGQSVIEGSLPYTALLLISLAAVMREGSEAVFFLFGFAQSGVDTMSLFTGGLAGMVTGVLIGYVVYRGLIYIPLKNLFQVTGWLLMLLAAGMASQAAWNLIVIDMLPPIIESMWNSSAWLSQESMVGELLHVLIGYDDNPSGMQLLVFIIALSAMLFLDRYCQSGSVGNRPVTS